MALCLYLPTHMATVTVSLQYKLLSQVPEVVLRSHLELIVHILPCY